MSQILPALAASPWSIGATAAYRGRHHETHRRSNRDFHPSVLRARPGARLLIEVVPVRIMPVDTTDYQMISIVYDYEVLIAAHEAVASLGLRLGFLTPEIVLADGGFEVLECTYAEPGIRSTCTPPSGEGPLSPDQMDNLYHSLEQETPPGEPSLRPPGTIRLLVIVKSERFPVGPRQCAPRKCTCRIVEWLGSG